MSDGSGEMAPPRRDRVVWLAVALVLIVHGWVVGRALPRPLDHDEGEHLRATAWMAAGQSIYRDFAENHTPFLYILLEPLAPDEDTIDALRQSVVSARLASAVAGTAAALCIAFIAVSLAGRSLAALPVLAALLASGWTWLRAVADVRSEPYTLLLFWCGTLLVLRNDAKPRRQMLAAGIGIGLVAVAGVWNPKWPLESLVVFGLFVVVWWRGARRSLANAVLSAAVALALPAVAVCIALIETTPSELVFHGYLYAGAIARLFRTSPLSAALFAESPRAFAFCPLWLHPWATGAAAISLLFTTRRKNLTRVIFIVLLLCASALELRFVYPYPRLWPQYFVMWAAVVSLLYGYVVASLAERFPRLTPVLATVVLGVWLAYEWRYLTKAVDERHWKLKEALLARLGPGEAAWVRPEELPTRAPAGSYYWYAFTDQVPISLDYARTDERARRFLPLLRDEDLPPCRILGALKSGRTNDVRLLDARAVRNLPRSRQCMETLHAIGAIRRIGTTPLWEVVRR